MRDRPLYALLVFQLLITAAACSYSLWAVPLIASGYQQDGLQIPLLARIALLRWPLVAVSLGALALAGFATFKRGKRGARLRLMAIGLTLTGLAFVALSMASVLPMLSG